MLAQTTAFVGGRLFDGTRNKPIENSIVLIEGKKIIYAGSRDKKRTPEYAQVIDITGKSILPGLIDCHIHYGEPRDLVQLLAWGVTSANCMFESSDEGLAMEKKTSDDSIHSPQIYATAPIFSCDSGWWYGEDFPIDSTINRFPQTPEEAREQVRKAKAKGIKRIKLMYDDMSWCRDPLPKLKQMQKEIMEALLDEAGTQRMLAEIHAPQLKDAREIENAAYHRSSDMHDSRDINLAKYAALAHGIIDDTITIHEKMSLLIKKMLYVPTFCVFEFLADTKGFMDNALGDERFKNALPSMFVKRYSNDEYYEHYQNSYPNIEFVKSHLSTLQYNCANIPKFDIIAMGTDMWALPGIGAHLEMQYMKEAGMEPLEIIIASTRTGSYFLKEHKTIGTIEKGKQADMIIIDGNPLDDIRNTRNIKTIVKHGVIFSHDELIEESKR